MGTAEEGGPEPQAERGLEGIEAGVKLPQPRFTEGRGFLLGFIGSWLPARFWGYQTTIYFFFYWKFKP